MMDKTFIEQIQKVTETHVVTVNGKEYVTRGVYNPPPPDQFEAEPLTIATLSGLVDYCTSDVDTMDDEVILHVVSYRQVDLISALRGTLRRREKYVVAQCEPTTFPFNTFMAHAQFMVGLQACFQDYGDRAKVMQKVGTIKNASVKTSLDDGITQQVMASSGITLVQEVDLPNPVVLQPFRTFREIGQPPSFFVLRVQASAKPGQTVPDVALYEADGSAWKREAVLEIRRYLADKLGDATDGITIIA